MDLYHLEYVSEIEKTGNISKAAENLHISQPTLSIYLNKLERSLGLQLFIRRKNELVPTEAGIKYVDACRRILSIRDELYQDLFAENHMELRLGILRTSLHIFNEAIQEMKSEFSQITFLPRILSSEQIYQEMLEGHVDMGCVTSYNPNVKMDFPKADYKAFKSYELVLMISRGNPVFSDLRLENGCLSEESYPILEKMPIFKGRNNMVQKRIEQDIFPRLGIKPRWREGLNDIEFMFQTLSMENSYTILPISRIKGGEIAQIPLPFHPKIQRIFIYPVRHYLNQAEKALIEKVSAAYENIPYYYNVSLL